MTFPFSRIQLGPLPCLLHMRIVTACEVVAAQVLSDLGSFRDAAPVINRASTIAAAKTTPAREQVITKLEPMFVRETQAAELSRRAPLTITLSSCRTCHLDKSLDEFDVSKASRGGFAFGSDCEECRREKNRAAYYAAQHSCRAVVTHPIRVECKRDLPANQFNMDMSGPAAAFLSSPAS